MQLCVRAEERCKLSSTRQGFLGTRTKANHSYEHEAPQLAKGKVSFASLEPREESFTLSTEGSCLIWFSEWHSLIG